MKPVLIVDGKKMEVISLHLTSGKPYKVEVYEGTPMESTTYYDVNWNSVYVENPLRIDFSKYLFDESKVEMVNEINAAIEKVLVDKSKELIELSLEHTEACLKYPFSDDHTKRKYELVQRQQMGLMDAQEIVTEFMYEDVDLSGGEDDASMQRMQPF
ncbi:MAG: hypothetical protein ABTA23_03520 [Solibacillus sp.]